MLIILLKNFNLELQNIKRCDIVLKVCNSNINVQEFVQKLKNYCEIGYENPLFLNCYRVLRNNYSDYIIVMEIAPNSSLRQCN